MPIFVTLIVPLSDAGTDVVDSIKTTGPENVFSSMSIFILPDGKLIVVETEVVETENSAETTVSHMKEPVFVDFIIDAVGKPKS